jgi:hypothetical protein
MPDNMTLIDREQRALQMLDDILCDENAENNDKVAAAEAILRHRRIRMGYDS